MNESLRVQIQENDSAQNCSPYLTPLIFQSFVEKLMDPTQQKTSKPGKKQAQADNKWPIITVLQHTFRQKAGILN